MLARENEKAKHDPKGVLSLNHAPQGANTLFKNQILSPMGHQLAPYLFYFSYLYYLFVYPLADILVRELNKGLRLSDICFHFR